ncbi:MAG: carbohydrate ABC transporter permease [Chloroflexota bacterium]
MVTVQAGARPSATQKSAYRRWAGQALRHVLVGGVGLLFVFPFVWMVLCSFKSTHEILDIPPTVLPRQWVFGNYDQAVTAIPFLRYTLNTLLISGGCAVGTVFSCSLVAFSFSRVRWRGREALFVLVLSTMLLPSEITLIPLYIVFKTLGWIGTYAPLMVPSFFGSAFFIFLLRQFFRTIPPELDEAARIDGAGYLTIFFRIILPLARPALAVVVVLTFLQKWTDFLGPLIYLNDPSTYTLSLGLQLFQSAHTTAWGPLMAASTLFMLPVIVLFALAQKTFISGITLGGLKG